jgi:hypothetical protein
MEINDVLVPSQVLINRHRTDKVQLLDNLADRAAASKPCTASFRIDRAIVL